MSAETVTHPPSKRDRVEPSLSDIFNVSTETNSIVKGLIPRLDAVEAKTSSLEDRVAKLEAAESQSQNMTANSSVKSDTSGDDKSSKPPELIVIGQEGPDKVRPDVTLVAKLLERPEGDIKVTFAGSTVVEVLYKHGQLEVVRHKLVGSGLWANIKSPPEVRAAQRELRKIFEWFGAQQECVGTCQWSTKTIVDASSRTLVGLSERRDRVVWHDSGLKLKWLSRS